MLYYKFEVTAPENNVMEEGNRVEANRYASKLREKADTFNLKNSDTYCFISNIDDSRVIAGIISKVFTNPESTAKAFLKSLELNDECFKCEEITLKYMQHLLSTSSRHSFITDDDEVLERYSLDNLANRFGGTCFGENIIRDDDKKTLYKRANLCLAGETIIPEYDRIYAGRKEAKGAGHPVHYVVAASTREMRKFIYKNLLSALYANGRIASKRYSYFNLSDVYQGSFFDEIYKSSKGSTVVIRAFEGDEEEEDEASGTRARIEDICKNIKKYRNDVLTIICLPRECVKIRDIFNEYLGSICIIDIKEELADKEKSIKYLKTLAKRKSVTADKELIEKIQDNELYTSGELIETFEAWYNERLKSKVYPQYEQFESIKTISSKEKAKGYGIADLDEMIGLTGAKAVIKKALSFYKMQKLCKDQGMNMDRPAMHMVFTGNPGTAKTTVARLFAKIMKENGILPKGNLVEVGRGDLVGKYVGWTAKVVQEKFNEAEGGVLFIDEAYSLVDDRNGSYGDEAINTIVQEMENRRNRLVVIFAGYPDKMEEFLNKNPGLRSRIAFHVPFEDYNTDELCQITKLMATKVGITFTEGAVSKLAGIYDQAQLRTDFGNGRFVRNIIETSRMNQASRLLEVPVDEITKTQIATITEDDIESPNLGKAEIKKPIGFCA